MSTSETLPYLTAAPLRQALPYPALIEALNRGYRSGIQAPLRQTHPIDGTLTTLLTMPVWQPAGALGVKLVTVTPDNPARLLPTVHALFVLFDAVSGVPMAMLDGEELTLRRTAAVSALASSFLSRPDSRTLLIVGTGTLAPAMAAAHCAVRPLDNVLVWGRSHEKAVSMLARLREQGVPDSVTLAVAEDLRAAAGKADIISCATTSTTPLIFGGWLAPGTHVDLVGGFKPSMREADDDLMAAAIVFVDTFSGAMAEAGDLVQPMAAGKLQRDAVVAELADLCSGRHPGRTAAQQITVFKSVGSAIADLCAAMLAWDSARPGR